MIPVAFLDAWLLRLPLKRPYRLSFGPVDALDTLMVRATLEGGGTGWGEATLLTGYTDETIADTWSFAKDIVAAGPEALRSNLSELEASHPFLTTAFRTAEEMARSSPYLSVGGTATDPLRVPILGLLQGSDAEALAVAAESLLSEGYRTLKLKVGFDVAADIANVCTAQRVLAGRARLRLDANQGYTPDDACVFVSRVDPAGIELFEQPCAAGDWDAHMTVAAVARRTGLPLMLDESIYSIREVERAADLGAAAFIKVKLMKFGSLERLDNAIARIRELGMTPVLGNGVANELACWMEACIAAGRIDNAGEMNGFLKPIDRLFLRPLRFHDGAIELLADGSPEIDVERLERLALAHARTTREIHISNPVHLEQT